MPYLLNYLRIMLTVKDYPFLQDNQSERSNFFNQSKSPYLPMIYHQSNSNSLFKAKKRVGYTGSHQFISLE